VPFIFKTAEQSSHSKYCDYKEHSIPYFYITIVYITMTMLVPIVVIFVCNALIILNVLRSSKYRAHLAHENILNSRNNWHRGGAEGGRSGAGNDSLELEEITGHLSMILEDDRQKRNAQRLLQKKRSSNAMTVAAPPIKFEVTRREEPAAVYYSKMNNQMANESTTETYSKRLSVRSSIAFSESRRTTITTAKKSARSDSIKITRMLLLMSLS
jgi:hypothetical protein